MSFNHFEVGCYYKYNGEGYDVNINSENNQQHFSLHYTEFDALVFLKMELKNNVNEIEVKE